MNPWETNHYRTKSTKNHNFHPFKMNQIELNNYIVVSFQLLLDDLQLSKIQNDVDKKQLITVLTMSAQEDISCCEDIVDVIRKQLKIISAESRILIMSLIESIILFVGGEYTHLFKKHIDEIFANAAEDADDDVQLQLIQFCDHWNLIFPQEKSQELEQSVSHLGIDNMFKIIEELNKKEETLMAEIEALQMNAAKQPESTNVKNAWKSDKNKRNECKKNERSENSRKNQLSSSVVVAAEKKVHRSAKTSPPENKIDQMLKNISFWMNTQFNSLKNAQHYSEIIF